MTIVVVTSSANEGIAEHLLPTAQVIRKHDRCYRVYRDQSLGVPPALQEFAHEGDLYSDIHYFATMTQATAWIDRDSAQRAVLLHRAPETVA
jgi:hypothetical protein